MHYDLFHLIQLDPLWIKGQEVTQLFKFHGLEKGKTEIFFNGKNLNE